jgi:hypothetical protein
MYTISVEPLSDTKPRMYSDGHDENCHGGLGTAAIILVDDPVVGCESIDSALAGIGELRTIQPNPILLKSVKESL